MFKGPQKSIVGGTRPDSRHLHGADGMGGVQYASQPDHNLIQSTPAPVAIMDLVNRFPGVLFLSG